jgi:cytochrome oxidase Cu insertion factor (SCO1/SenC/PrrC family)
VCALAVLVVACGGDDSGNGGSAELSAEGRAGYSRTPAPQVGDLLFLDYADDPAGVEYRPVAEPGNLLLVYFGYLSCPDVCPLTLSDISRALSEMPPELSNRVETAMVSVDPERDTGEQIANYLDVFTEKNYALLAPDAEALDAAGERFSAVWRIPEHEPGETYWVDHSAVLYVVDDAGAVVWEFPYRTQAGPLAAALIELFDEAAE